MPPGIRNASLYGSCSGRLGLFPRDSDVGLGRPPQLGGVLFRRDHFRRQLENLQTLSPASMRWDRRSSNLPAAEVLFVSSNQWDAAGAKAFGYPVCWCIRSGAAVEDWGFAPDSTVSRLDQIGETLKAKPNSKLGSYN